MVYLVIGIVIGVLLVGAARRIPALSPRRRSLPPSGQSPTVEVPPGRAGRPRDTCAGAPLTTAPPVRGSRRRRRGAAAGRGAAGPAARRGCRGSQCVARPRACWSCSRATPSTTTSGSEVEDTLSPPTSGSARRREIVDRLRERVRVLGTRTPEQVRDLLRDELLSALGAGARPHAAHRARTTTGPAVVLVVGVNGTGKTTTCGKLARVLVGDGRSVLLGAADTFRAAAADQLATWAERVGATVVRGPEGADPASVAFDAVRSGTEQRRRHRPDRHRRAAAHQVGPDGRARQGQAGRRAAGCRSTRCCSSSTPRPARTAWSRPGCSPRWSTITGIVLTKLDGTAKGGIVIAVQRELGVPVKLVGLGEGPDDLAPFEPDGLRRCAARRRTGDRLPCDQPRLGRL